MEKPDSNDYLTDDESDDAEEFEIKVPELASLLSQFEKDDEAILNFNEKQLKKVNNLEVRGFEPPPRHQFVNEEAERLELLNSNIEIQRQKQISVLPSYI